MGAGDAASEAPAAFLALVLTAAPGGTALDAAFTLQAPELAQALADYNAAVSAAKKLTTLPSSPPKQRELAAAVDKTRLEQLTAAMQTESARAHLRLVQQPAAGAWLAALPAESLGLHMEPACPLQSSAPDASAHASCT